MRNFSFITMKDAGAHKALPHIGGIIRRSDGARIVDRSVVSRRRQLDARTHVPLSAEDSVPLRSAIILAGLLVKESKRQSPAAQLCGTKVGTPG